MCHKQQMLALGVYFGTCRVVTATHEHNRVTVQKGSLCPLSLKCHAVPLGSRLFHFTQLHDLKLELNHQKYAHHPSVIRGYHFVPGCADIDASPRVYSSHWLSSSQQILFVTS